MTVHGLVIHVKHKHSVTITDENVEKVSKKNEPVGDKDNVSREFPEVRDKIVREVVKDLINSVVKLQKNADSIPTFRAQVIQESEDERISLEIWRLNTILTIRILHAWVAQKYLRLRYIAALRKLVIKDTKFDFHGFGPKIA